MILYRTVVAGLIVSLCMLTTSGCSESSNQDTVGKTVYQGSYAIRKAKEIEGIKGYTEITGDLYVDAPQLVSLDLPDLKRVGGDMLVYAIPALTSINMPALEEVGGALRMLGTTELPILEFPSLKTVGAYLWFEFNEGMFSFNLPELTSVGAEQKEAVEIENQLVLGDLWVYDNDVMTNFSIPKLTYIRGDLEVDDNTALETFSISALAHVPGNLSIHENAVLTDFDLPSMASVGADIVVFDNPSLAQCLVDELIKQVKNAEGIEGGYSFCSPTEPNKCNNEYCTCTSTGNTLKASCP